MKRNLSKSVLILASLMLLNGYCGTCYASPFEDSTNVSITKEKEDTAVTKSSDNKEVCLSMLLKTTHIHPTDEISSVIAAPLKGKDYLLDTKIEYKFGYTLLHWIMTFPDRNNQQITQIFRRDWF